MATYYIRSLHYTCINDNWFSIIIIAIVIMPYISWHTSKQANHPTGNVLDIYLPSFLVLLSVPLLRWSPACREDLAPLVLHCLRVLQVVPWLRDHPDHLEVPVAQDRHYVQLLPLVHSVHCLHEIRLDLVGLEDLAFLVLLQVLDLHQTLGIQGLPLDQ